MMKSIRGMNDVLPDDIWKWQKLESVLLKLLNSFNYKEIRTPILEKTDVFVRGVGENTDIVEKEIYLFDDRNGESICLRPEGTAGVIRACIEHGLVAQHTCKLWYLGNMFRYERPQKGRQRQFYQLGVEYLGENSYICEIELLVMQSRLWKELDICSQAKLHINSIGGNETRKSYKEALVRYYHNYFDELDSDSQRRLTTNPLRILDSKNAKTQALFERAPKLIDFMSNIELDRFDNIKKALNELGIEYIVDYSLVRGLDYYNDFVFEWKLTELLGAQNTICAGGRYDFLTKQFDYKEVPAVGFAIGIDRLLLALGESKASFLSNEPKVCDIFFACLGTQAQVKGIAIREEIMEKMPHIKTHLEVGKSTLKNMLKKSNQIMADYAIIIGENELEKNTVQIKALKIDKFSKESLSYVQQEIDFCKVVDYIAKIYLIK